MRLGLLLLSLIFVIHYRASNAIVLADFQQQALLQHNYQRQLHCTGSMTLNSTINNMAQNYANYLAANNIFNHSGVSGYGENLWMLSSSVALTYINGSSPTISWYNEISSYNYNSPGFLSATGHFTQVVWVNSVQLGIGIAFTTNNQTAYVVGNYYPAGNVIGSFPANVLPVCIGTTTTANASNNSAIINTEMNIRLSAVIVITGSIWNLMSYN